jgi:hypothetical protein
MKSHSFYAVVVGLFVVACGADNSDNLSQLNERIPAVRPQGEPNYKTKDGVELMAWVKRPEVRKAICNTLREARNQGYSVASPEAFAMVAKSFELHPVEAEIVAVYAAEMQCPELN